MHSVVLALYFPTEDGRQDRNLSLHPFGMSSPRLLGWRVLARLTKGVLVQQAVSATRTARRTFPVFPHLFHDGVPLFRIACLCREPGPHKGVCYVPLPGHCAGHNCCAQCCYWTASVGQFSGSPVLSLLLSTSRAVQRVTGASTMATRLPRCFAAAAATAAAASATATSGTPAGNTNAGQASRRRRNGQEEEEEAKDRRGPHCRLPASAFPEKIGYASSAKHCGGNNVRPSIDAEGRPSPSWKDVIASVRLGRVAYADATGFPSVVEEAERGGVGAGGDAVLPSLEEGEKPEFIQRADEQVRRWCSLAMFSSSFQGFCVNTAIQTEYQRCMYQVRVPLSGTERSSRLVVRWCRVSPQTIRLVTPHHRHGWKGNMHFFTSNGSRVRNAPYPYPDICRMPTRTSKQLTRGIWLQYSSTTVVVST